MTVARAVAEQLPAERLVYVGDTEHVPYGPRPIAEVRRLTLDICDHLVRQEVKALVIACNSASAASLATSAAAGSASEPISRCGISW